MSPRTSKTPSPTASKFVGAEIDPAIKSRSLGLVLIKVVGDKVLSEAVASLGTQSSPVPARDKPQ